MNNPVLYIVIPCYNEEAVLPVTAPLFLKKLEELAGLNLISDKSKILFVNDGSTDSTWEIIKTLAKKDCRFTGISQSRNRGHQSSLLAGLMEAKDKCDITISIDCDGQDDLNAMNEMVKKYLSGCEIVYGVRNSRKTDSFFKRTTAQGFYSFMNFLGAKTVFNHADYRLMSSRALFELANYKEVNLFLRGIVPLLGFKTDIVYYSREKRIAGESHYPLSKMLSLAADGITSLSIKPIKLIAAVGFVISVLSFIGIFWSVIVALSGESVSGWASIVCIVCFMGGIQLVSLGIIGEYIGKIYLETKNRPRYIISERTEDENFKDN